MGYVAEFLRLMAYPACALAPPAADGLDYLFAVVAYGTEEHPPFETIEATAPELFGAVVVFVYTDDILTLR
jgi:hypothetical protein